MASDRRGNIRLWVILILLAAAGIWAYRHSFAGPFIFDDLNTIVENQNLSNMDSLAAMMEAPPNRSTSGRPLVQLTIAIDYAIGGLNHVGVYHATNLLIHILCGLALWGVLRRTMRRVPKLATRADALAAMAALIWIVHPIQTAAVTYIVQRGECLASLMMLLTLYAFIRSIDSPRPLLWHIAAVAACAAAMACKEIAVATPVLVLAYDRAFVSGGWRQTIRERWSFYVGLAATWMVLIALMSSGPRSDSAGFGIPVYWLDYARTQFAVIAHYIRLVFWPRPLVLDYEWPVAQSWSEVPIGPAMVTSAVVAATLAGVWLWPRWSVLGLWFLGILAPTSSVVPLLDAAFEHRMYLPSAAIIVAVVVGLAFAGDAIRRFLPHPEHRESRNAGMPESWGAARSLRIGWVATAIVAAALAQATNVRNFDYRSSLSIWRDTVQKRPENPRAHFNLSRAMENAGDYAGAIEQLRVAVDLDRQYFAAVQRLGMLLAMHDTPQAAIDYYAKQLVLHPEWDGGWFDLGMLHRRMGNLPEARIDFAKVIQLAPGTPQANAAGQYMAEIDKFNHP